MFTGIIEELGFVRTAKNDGLVIAARAVLEDLRVADSIAVNGVCLTVVARDAEGFCVDVVPETLSRTNLGFLRTGDPVNLERSMPAGGRFGGHIVQGHVDCTAELIDRQTVGNSIIVTLSLPEPYARYVVAKGFIALDGASLTVVDVESTSFRIALIPFTQQMIAMSHHATGYRANVEVDILGKYLERLLASRLQGAGAEVAPATSPTREGG